MSDDSLQFPRRDLLERLRCIVPYTKHSIPTRERVVAQINVGIALAREINAGVVPP